MFIRILYDYDCDDVCKFTSDVFVRKEPICNCLQITKQEFIDAFNNIIHNCCASGMSYCIKDPESDEIMSVMLALSYNDYKNSHIPEWSHTPRITPLLTILDEMAHLEYPDPVHTLYLFIACTKDTDEVSGKGFAKLLLNRIIDKARSNGYKFIVSDATNVISQHILINRFGFVNAKEITYNKYVYNDECIFNDIKCTQGVIRVIKTL